MLIKPWEEAMTPFRIFGNLYFVGTHGASSHLIDTGDGLVLLDSGYQETLYLVLESIRRLGFDPSAIKYIVHSHGHVDHAGATRSLMELVQAESWIGAPDEAAVAGRRPLTWAPEYELNFHFFTPTHLLHDGDHIRLGCLDMFCVATPGHTPGTFSFFWDVPGENGETVRAGTMGGLGFNTLEKAYIRKYRLEGEAWRGALSRSLARCREEKVDLFIGNHVWNNDTPGKYERLRQGERDAFVDPGEWLRFLDDSQEKYENFLRENPLS